VNGPTTAAIRVKKCPVGESIDGVAGPARTGTRALEVRSMSQMSACLYATPRAVTRLDQCAFYHSMDLPCPGPV